MRNDAEEVRPRRTGVVPRFFRRSLFLAGNHAFRRGKKPVDPESLRQVATPREHGVDPQFALIFLSVARVISTSPSSAMTSAGRDAVVRLRNASRYFFAAAQLPVAYAR